MTKPVTNYYVHKDTERITPSCYLQQHIRIYFFLSSLKNDKLRARVHIVIVDELGTSLTHTNQYKGSGFMHFKKVIGKLEEKLFKSTPANGARRKSAENPTKIR
ncbi:hypothetical protein H5410_051369 [Solanum commersonii]|uniref:Uncharacterized protein n=1 Tax=Solanum commersonii TaxID=4109 RepID=A0A9J5X0I1_SOLCO|nr:hypothetical protein H5410_051369 [Solanum commersonii]